MASYRIRKLNISIYIIITIFNYAYQNQYQIHLHHYNNVSITEHIKRIMKNARLSHINVRLTLFLAAVVVNSDDNDNHGILINRNNIISITVLLLNVYQKTYYYKSNK